MDPEVQPKRQPLRPISFHLRDAVEKEINQQVRDGILVKVDETSGPTPWVSNLVVVSKQTLPELKVRLTCDSKLVNKAIKRTRYPSKTLDNIIYLVNGLIIFTKVDFIKAFTQYLLARNSWYLTTITTHLGLYQYLRLHMGICCASEEFTEEIWCILQDYPGQLNMTDVVLVYGKTKEEHHENLMRVLKTLEVSGITVNTMKCEFYKTELIFFGLKMSAQGISPTEDEVRALREAKASCNAKELRSFLGILQYLGRFIQNLSTKAEPLWRLTNESVRWSWTDVEQKAFVDLKEAISTSGLGYFKTDWNTELVVDTGQTVLGAVLAQTYPVDKRDRSIVSFGSRLLTEIERRYSQFEKEALTAVWGCERFWIYLLGRIFYLITDNRAVQLIVSNGASRPPARIERWTLRLTQFEFISVHKPGSSNIDDYFSRHPISAETAAANLDTFSKEQFIFMIVADAILGA